jgi:hypothetical protein
MSLPKSKAERTEHKVQSDKFKEAARSLGCDEDPAHFDAALKKVARHKPSETERPPEAKCHTKPKAGTPNGVD